MVWRIGVAIEGDCGSLHTVSRDKGGALGRWIKQGEDFLRAGDTDLLSRAHAAIFSTTKGAVTPPISGTGSSYLFEVTDLRKGRERTFEQVRARVQQDYSMMKMQNAYRDIVEQQLAGEGVILYEEALGG